MLTRKQHELICFINDRLEETGVSPSFEEMKEALDLKSKSGVHRLISALEERAFIRRLPNRARALEVVRLPDTQGTAASAAPAPQSRPVVPANDTIDLPLAGRIVPALAGSLRPEPTLPPAGRPVRRPPAVTPVPSP